MATVSSAENTKLDHADQEHSPSATTACEIWKAVVGLEGRYEVSSHGRIRSILSTRGNHGRKESHILKPGYGGVRVRYLRIALYDGSRKRIGRYIHDMVLQAFVGPRPSPLYHGAHEDDDSFNNHLSNLSWQLGSDNVRKANEKRWSPLDLLVGTRQDCPF